MYKIKIKINKMAIADISQLLNHSQTRKCLHVILIHLFEMSNWKILNIFPFRYPKKKIDGEKKQLLSLNFLGSII